jgi:hypothetical protein
VTPARVRWRLLHSGQPVFPWRVAADFRVSFRPQVVNGSDVRFARIYASATRQNHPNKPGLFRYLLSRRLDTRRYPDGEYHLEVEATDVRGNRGRRVLAVAIANRQV